MRFIQMVIDEEFSVSNRPKKDLIAELYALNFRQFTAKKKSKNDEDDSDDDDSVAEGVTTLRPERHAGALYRAHGSRVVGWCNSQRGCCRVGTTTSFRWPCGASPRRRWTSCARSWKPRRRS